MADTGPETPLVAPDASNANPDANTANKGSAESKTGSAEIKTNTSNWFDDAYCAEAVKRLVNRAGKLAASSLIADDVNGCDWHRMTLALASEPSETMLLCAAECAYGVPAVWHRLRSCGAINSALDLVHTIKTDFNLNKEAHQGEATRAGKVVALLLVGLSDREVVELIKQNPVFEKHILCDWSRTPLYSATRYAWERCTKLLILEAAAAEVEAAEAKAATEAAEAAAKAKAEEEAASIGKEKDARIYALQSELESLRHYQFTVNPAVTEHPILKRDLQHYREACDGLQLLREQDAELLRKKDAKICTLQSEVDAMQDKMNKLAEAKAATEAAEAAAKAKAEEEAASIGKEKDARICALQSELESLRHYQFTVNPAVTEHPILKRDLQHYREAYDGLTRVYKQAQTHSLKKDAQICTLQSEVESMQDKMDKLRAMIAE